jgi:hypothetical protein
MVIQFVMGLVLTYENFTCQEGGVSGGWRLCYMTML